MSKFITSELVYNRIKTDSSSFNEHKAIIVYKDMKDKNLEINLSSWRPIKKGGDVPWHRVYSIKYNNIIIWVVTSCIFINIS